MQEHCFTFAGEPQRLDAALAGKLGLSRAFAANLVQNGQVTVNGKKVLTDSVSATGAILNWVSGTYTCNEQGQVTVRITCTAGTYCLTSVLFGE